MSALVESLKQRVKRQDTPLTRTLFPLLKSLRTLDLPPIPGLHQLLGFVVPLVHGLVTGTIRALYWKPVFLTQLQNRPRRLLLFGLGRPLLMGNLKIRIGDDCRMSAQMTWTGRSHGDCQPELVIGNNVGLGWSTGIYVGRRIVLGDNVRIAGEASLVGYPGHPLDAAARARGEPDTEDQVGDIIIERDVWLARGVKVMPEVTIGAGTVVAAGSVVTKSLPAGVLAGGVPAKVIRTLTPEDQASIPVEA